MTRGHSERVNNWIAGHSSFRRALGNGAWLGSAQIIVGLSGFLTIRFLARTLGPDAFGEWQIAVASSTYLVIISGLGTSQYGSWLVASAPDSASGIAALVMRVRVLGAAVAFVLWLAIGTAIGGDIGVLLCLVAAAALIRSLWPDWLLQGTHRGRLLAALTSAYPAIVFVSLLLVVTGPRDSFAVPIVQVVVALALGISSWTLALNKRNAETEAVQVPSTRRLLAESVPLGVASVLVQVVTNMDYVLLGAMRSARDTATYAAAAMIPVVVQGIGVAFHAAVFPSLTAIVKDREAVVVTVKRLSGVTLALALPAAAGLFVLSAEIIQEVYGSEYRDGALPLRILALYLPFGFYAPFYGSLLIARGERTYYAKTFGIAATVNVTANLVAIPAYGGVGAAIVTVVCAALITALQIAGAGVGVLVARGTACAAALATATMVLFLSQTTAWNLPARIVLGGCVYTCALLAYLRIVHWINTRLKPNSPITK
jgi:O-antigen/teichoic acid export membrane protein